MNKQNVLKRMRINVRTYVRTQNISLELTIDVNQDLVNEELLIFTPYRFF